jgi:hypothetical protein
MNLTFMTFETLLSFHSHLNWFGCYGTKIRNLVAMDTAMVAMDE